MLAQKQPYIQRVRNSSLVDEAEEHVNVGRGAFLTERSCTERSSGLLRRENAGMSSEMEVGILQAEYPRFPE